MWESTELAVDGVAKEIIEIGRRKSNILMLSQLDMN